MDSPLSTLNSQRAGQNRRAERSGFALLITITLLAFLVILLVGLATYTRVETAVAGNTQRQAQARQNALVGLNIAVAQLQKYAGPDMRVTATADVLDGVIAQKRRYTGVWDTSAPGAAPVWLASGLETGTTPDVTSTIGVANRIELVGFNTDGTTAAGYTFAALQTITAPGVPGRTGDAPIGRYAWWVGDNGVKADVTRTDLTSRLNYAPFVDSDLNPNAEMRTRLLQQTGLGAGAFNTASNAVAFDPRDTANLTIAANALNPQQIPFLRNTAGNALGLAQLKTHYHNWTVGNHGVLARTNVPIGTPSLRHDLSIDPGPLGTAFAAWSDYPSYMESPEVNPLNIFLSQPASALRRRYKMTPAVTDANGSQFSVTPVLSYAAIAFSIRNDLSSDPTKLECSMRAVVELWNPYTGALVPEDLEVRVTGLPDVNVRDLKSGFRHLELQNLVGDPTLTDSPIRFLLPWALSTTNDAHASWLPGRVYNWSAISNTAQPATGVNSMDFDVRDLQGAGQGIVRDAGAPFAVSTGANTANFNSRQCFMFRSAVLQVEVRRASDGTLLATFRSPPFNDFRSGSNPIEVDKRSLDFAFVFRLADPTSDGFAWLQTSGYDPRLPQPAQNFAAPYTYAAPNGNGIDPALAVLDTTGNNVATFTAGNPGLLLDRYPGTSTSLAGTRPDEDVPIFELPRSPLLSVGQLQHLSIPTLQPFWVGQSAASTGPAQWNNALFDQHFFSGLGKGVNWTDVSRPLPNTLARLLRHKPDGSAVSAADFIQAPAIPVDPNSTDPAPVQPPVAGPSAKFLLQGGAFNLNSVDPDAWAAVLRSLRFPTGREFKYLNSSDSTGTNSDTSTAMLTAEAAFPRFSQSAQETYKVTPGAVQSEPGTTTNTVLKTEYYRQGFRTLDAAKVTALAQNITTAIKARLKASGPFFSVEEFLNPAAGPGTPSLLEQAILDLNLNVDPSAVPTSTTVNYPFSSMFLTQADIMTALAPVLFVRSDTFTVRAYGEATNPVTGLAEGKAWCEAVVQRFPEPFSPAIPNQPADDEYKTPPGDFGRRFKIISLRWLTKSDI